MRNNQTKPNQTQTTPIGSAQGISRSRFQASKVAGREEPGVNPYKLPSVPAGVTLDDEGKKAWATALGELGQVVNRHMFLLWVEPMLFAGIANESVVITSDYRRSRWVAVRYGSVIGDVCRGLGFRGALICEEEA